MIKLKGSMVKFGEEYFKAGDSVIIEVCNSKHKIMQISDIEGTLVCVDSARGFIEVIEDCSDILYRIQDDQFICIKKI